MTKGLAANESQDDRIMNDSANPLYFNGSEIENELTHVEDPTDEIMEKEDYWGC